MAKKKPKKPKRGKEAPFCGKWLGNPDSNYRTKRT